MHRQWFSRIGRAALVSAALVFAAGATLAKAPSGGGHGGGGGGHGGGGGGHSGGGHSGGGGGGRSSGGGSASFSGRSAPASASRTSNFAPSTASGARSSTAASTWNRNGTWNNNNWNHNGNWNGNWNHRNNFGFFFGYPFFGSWFGGGYPWPYYYSGFPAWYYWNDYAYNPGPAYVYASDGSVAPTDQAPPPPSDMPKLDDNAVLIGVRVPESATIWFDGDKTTQTGTFREFVSPPLEPGQKFTYEIKASWLDNGKEVNRTRKIDVYAGDRMMVNFMAPVKNPSPQGPAKLAPPKPVPATPPQP